jgi:hypothetical protein
MPLHSRALPTPTTNVTANNPVGSTGALSRQVLLSAHMEASNSRGSHARALSVAARSVIRRVVLSRYVLSLAPSDEQVSFLNIQ